MKVEKGIDSSSTEIVAELGDSFTEELAGSGTNLSNDRVLVQNQQHPTVSQNLQ